MGHHEGGASVPAVAAHRRSWSWRLTATALTAALAASLLPTPQPAAADDTVRVNVQAAPGQLNAAARAVTASGGRVAAQLPALETLVVDVAAGQVDGLTALSSVIAATEDGVVPPAAVPAEAIAEGVVDSPLDHDEAYTDPARGVSLDHVTRVIGARELWARGVTGAGVGVALIDSGVVPVDGLTAGNVRNGPDLSFESQLEELAYLDTYGHGTAMAGIIAAQDPGPRNAAGGFDAAHTSGRHLGVAPDAGLLSLKLASFEGATDVSQVLAAIDWVVQHRDDEGLNVRVINLSFGTDGAQDYRLDPLAYAVEVAWRHGIVVVVSAGNDGDDYGRLANPAISPFVIAVGAADTRGTLRTDDDEVTAFSNRGDGVRNPDLLAPGRSVLSLRSPGSFIDVRNPQPDVAERYLKGSGTSQAAAVVSGAVALLLQERPELTPDEVKYLLTAHATPLAAPATEAGAGLLDLRAAVSAPLPADGVAQTHEFGTGTGSLQAARGSVTLGEGDEALVGEHTILGPFDSTAWARESLATRSWRDGAWLGQEWSDDCWCAESWTGRTWRTRSWRDDSWATRSWRTGDWDTRSWREAGWDTRSWRDAGWYTRSWRAEDWTN
ncbi:S8 family serine peptidase [Egicoccus halophilus]|uniref:Peptidase S8/S53 domain-containing protein n=1 Tax=Egicoccus halophilus TaxID=1670830 RepID=A0A8J3A7F5_9ACTN|nr:S8 family serine peptidase [Egicoccus halophilus]GGI05639.1 hypothetical protein GCM10011354_15090 [Egicoccus halophilus]